MLSHETNEKLDTIAGWYIDKQICDGLINYFENNPQHHSKGTIGSQGKDVVDPTYKDSTDIRLWADQPIPELKNYLLQLKECLAEYKKIYIHCDQNHDRWSIIERINIQKYNPNQGFHAFHSERVGLDSMQRHLVFMTYLNDVTDGGETEWLYQNTKLKAEKGLTVIWSADWSLVHRGIASPTQTKYIITGWLNYF